jgi:co-chaperonin GroES (HSP10)
MLQQVLAQQQQPMALEQLQLKMTTFTVPTGAVAFNSQKITGLADPTAAQDAATKNYVDGVAQGLNVHDSALVATIANLAWTYAAGSTGADGGTGVGATLTNPSTGTSAIDGYTVVLNDRVLVKNQTTKTQNGIYYVSVAGTTGVATVLTRATDADNHIAGQVTAGDFVFVAGVSGTTSQIAQGWSQIDTGTATTPPKGIKLGTDNIEFSQFSGAGTYTASNGVLLTGSNFTFSPLSTGGLQTAAGGASIKLPANSGLTTDSTGTYVTAGTGLSITGGTISLSTAILQKYSATIGDGSSTVIAVTHSLGSRDVQVTVYDAASYNEVMCDVVHTSTSVVTLTFSVAPTSSAYRVVVIG